jgi:hypothetical protein
MGGLEGESVAMDDGGRCGRGDCDVSDVDPQKMERLWFGLGVVGLGNG